MAIDGLSPPFAVLHNALKLLFAALQIGKRKLRIDCFNIGQWVYFIGNMNDVWVLKAPDDMCNGVGLANIRQKLIAKTLALWTHLQQDPQYQQTP